jgi:GTPase-activator protein for Ras-like GTPase
MCLSFTAELSSLSFVWFHFSHPSLLTSRCTSSSSSPSSCHGAARFPDATQSQTCSLIGGFYLLRFVNPAIVTPQAFMLVNSKLSVNTRRNLTLVCFLDVLSSSPPQRTSRVPYRCSYLAPALNCYIICTHWHIRIPTNTLFVSLSTSLTRVHAITVCVYVFPSPEWFLFESLFVCMYSPLLNGSSSNSWRKSCKTWRTTFVSVV